MFWPLFQKTGKGFKVKRPKAGYGLLLYFFRMREHQTLGFSPITSLKFRRNTVSDRKPESSAISATRSPMFFRNNSMAYITR